MAAFLLMRRLRTVGATLKQTLTEFLGDECPQMAAALAYYAVFSLAPLLVLVLSFVGLWVDPGQVREAMLGQVQDLIGPSGAQLVESMLMESAFRLDQGLGPLFLSLAALLFGATGVFVQLQVALNRAWSVEQSTEKGAVKAFFLKRLVSFGMVLTIALLLLISLVLSAVVTVVSGYIQSILPDSILDVLLRVLDLTVSLALITGLFAAIFRFLPDVRLKWRDVGVGAFVTALLFSLGKWGIGVYLGSSDVGSVFGAAGTLAVLFIWVYYSAMILLIGAEFTQVYVMRRTGRETFQPTHGASLREAPHKQAPQRPSA